MSEARKTLFLCTCGGTMTLDSAAIGRHCGRDASVHNQLCRAELGALVGAAPGAAICCTQETPVFEEALAEAVNPGVAKFVNIRESAGWSDEGAAATPKIAALIAAASVETRPSRTMTVRSEGRVLIYGAADAVLVASEQLCSRLSVTAVLQPPAEGPPPAVTRYPVMTGRLTGLSGALGRYRATFESLATAVPWSRAELTFGPMTRDAQHETDIVIDLSGGATMLSGDDLIDGYLRPDPRNPAAIQKALFDASDLVGEFEKPIYVAFQETLCAHSRSAIVGCTRCLDICPASAIAPAGDHVRIDAAACAGCGACASVCPTGAATYDMPATETLVQRLRAMLRTYRDAGGVHPILFFHNPREGSDLIRIMARFGRGLPARVLPVALNEITQLGFEVLAAAFAYGADRVVVLATAGKPNRLAGLIQQAAYVDTVLEGLGYGAGRIAILEDRDPDVVCDNLHSFAPLPAHEASGFIPSGGRRSMTSMALHALHRHAPAPVDHLPMPEGAPFGAVEIDVAGCTLCLACVGACPTAALSDNPDAPMLRFTERACIQCGLCRNTCPEHVMTLVPRVNLTSLANTAVLLKEEEPFECISCGKPFGARSSIERTIARLVAHPMFAQDSAALNRLRMCEECRVLSHFSDDQPLAHGKIPRTRTTDDYQKSEQHDDE